jgi:hypothetical protein
MVDYVMVMLAGAAKHTQAKLVIGTEDMVDTGKFHCWIAKSVSPSQERATRTHDRSNSSSSSVNRLAPRLPSSSTDWQVCCPEHIDCSWATSSTTSLSF